MFRDLFLLEKERTPKEAFGFYLAYLLLIGLLGGLGSFLFTPPDASMTFAENFQAGAQTGYYVGVILCLALSFAIIYKKNCWSFGLVLIGVLSGIFAVLLGAILGLVPTAYLTTKKNSNNE